MTDPNEALVEELASLKVVIRNGPNNPMFWVGDVLKRCSFELKGKP